MEEPKERKKLDPNSPVVQRVMRIREKMKEKGIPLRPNPEKGWSRLTKDDVWIAYADEYNEQH